MASVEAGQAAGATTDNAQIWDGEQRGCKGKFTKRHCLAVGALAGGAVVALGLFFGLSSSSNNESGTRIVGQATDPNAVGCVVDDRSARIMTSLLTDEALTPTVSQGVQEMKCRVWHEATAARVHLMWKTHISFCFQVKDEFAKVSSIMFIPRRVLF